MNKIFHFITCTAIVFAVFSCSFFDEDNPSHESEDVATIPDSVKQKIVEQDSLMRDLVNKVDTLTNTLNEAKRENAELSTKVKSLESPKSTMGYMALAAMLISIIALVFNIVRSKGVTKEQVGEQIKHSLDESSRIRKLQETVELLSSQRPRSMEHQTNFALHDAENRIWQLEKTIKQILQQINSPVQNEQQKTLHAEMESNSPRRSEESQHQKVGYAKVDTDIYFTTIFESNQEGCVFKLTFTSQTKGKYNIIALDKIQSRNDWQKKVEYSGVSIKEATDFRLEDEGVCEKIDENTWKVTKPLKIRLIK